MPNTDAGDVGTALGLVFTAALISVAIYGWVLMLTAGALGWNIGYAPACGLVFLAGFVTGDGFKASVERR